MKLHRVRRFPSVLEGREPQSIYLERAPGQRYFTFYVTFADPEFYTSSIPESQIGEWIANSVNNTKETIFVQDIAERDSLVAGGSLTTNASVVVADATGDIRFKGIGGMMYFFNAQTGVFLPTMRIKEDPYAKTHWNELDGAPISSPEDIDEAVGLRHGHINKETIDGLGFSMLSTGKEVLTFKDYPVGTIVLVEPVW